jgi:diacylglycerol O-acyltransferase
MASALGSDTRMSEAEALMWRLERHDPRFRAVIAVIISLDRSPGIDTLRHRTDVLSRVLPRFRARVAPGPTPIATPIWEPDPDFDLDRHVETMAAPGAGTLDDVLAFAGPLVAEGLDLSRPLWHLTLVEGMAAGRAALVVRLHHTFTDGLGALKLAMVLFDLDPDAPVPDLPELDEPAPRSAPQRALDDVRHEAGVAANLVRWTVPAVRRMVRDAIVDPRAGAAATLGLARSVGRAVVPSSRPCSPLMTGRSTASVFASLSMGLDDTRDVGRAAGATVNDVFLSGVLAGLSHYHARHRLHPDVLRLGVPLSLRAAGDDSLRNQFFPARLLAPLQIADPFDRLRAVHDLVVRQRAEPALEAYGSLTAVAGRMPPAEVLVERALTSVDVMASNVVGSADPLFLAGARLLRMIPFGPRSGAGLNLTTVSYDGTLHVGVNIDPAATPDTDVLLECLAEAFSDPVIYA